MAYMATSRYEELTDASADGVTVVIGVRKETSSTLFTTYMARYGDTFDRIAARIFGDPTRWWEVADINPHVPFPEDIPAGTVLRVPTR